MASDTKERTAKERVLWAVGLAAVIFYALIPVAWIVSLSLKPSSQLTDGKFFPRSTTLENYRAIFEDSQFPSALRNSIGIALISTVLAVTLAMFAAYAIVRLDFPGRKLVLAGALAIAMFPPVSVIGPLFNMWRTLHLFDTWAGPDHPLHDLHAALAIWTLSAFFREIPGTSTEGRPGRRRHPVSGLPQGDRTAGRSGHVTSAILVFIFAWNDFLFATSLTSTNKARTVPAAIAFFTGSSQFEEPTGSIAAASVVVTVPIIIMVLIFQRRIVPG
jgi:multiple sugar transport system permease protein